MYGFRTSWHTLVSVIVVIVLVNKQRIVSAGGLSGIYVDNGHGQTVMHRQFNNDDQQEVEHEILELLGLPDRPMKQHKHPSMKKSAPQYLLDVYQRLTESSEGVNSRSIRSTPDNLISDIDRVAIDQSDIIMTFLNKHMMHQIRHEHGRRLWFDVDEVAKDLSLMVAELRIYQNPSLGKWHNTDKEFVISVYNIINADGEKELEMLSSANTTAKNQGWLELNVTSALSRWVEDGANNKGLYISAAAIDRLDHEVKLDDIGLISARGDEEFQPFMVGFFKGQEIIQPVKQARAKRSATASKNKRKKPASSELRNPLIDTKIHDHQKSCQIQTLYVSFKDLNWQDWIIAPEGYGAYFCSGECNFPLNAHMNATNHAIVQTLVHLLHPSKVPKPCCAPTKLSPISVLYFLDESNVNLKKYKNMVVKSCGCH